MMHISQLYVLSSRGDKLVFKDYRQDIPKASDEIFYRKFKFWDGKDHQAPTGDCPPVFFERGIHFFHIKVSGVLFVATSLDSGSASYVLEVLNRTVKITKDYLGVLTEESIRKNFVLVYELFDELIDSGVVQDISTEKIRPNVFNDVIVVKPEETSPGSGSLMSRIKRGELISEKTKRSSASQFSVLSGDKERKNEIYIDVVERLNTVFNPLGTIISADVEGSIIMKSFLAGAPDLFLGLNEDLVLGKNDGRAKYASVILDSVNFHESADFSKFESEKVVSIKPPNGEFTIMNYRLTSELPQPFRIVPSIEVISPYMGELTIRITANFASTSNGMKCELTVPVPKSTTSLAVDYPAGVQKQTHEYKVNEKQLIWKIEKFPGGSQQSIKIRFSTASPINAAARKEISPITMDFDVPMHSVSGMAVKSLRIEERSKSYQPQRWVRNITQAGSYAVRFQ